MTLNASTIQCLPMASVFAHSLPYNRGLALWSGCQHVTSFRNTRTAFAGFSNPPHPWNPQYRFFQSLARPRHLHYNTQLLLPTKTTPSVPQILFHRTRRLHSTSEEPTTDSAPSSQSSSNKESSSDSPILDISLFLLLVFGPAAITYERGWKRGAQELRDQLPDGKLFTAREGLREEEKQLNKTPKEPFSINVCKECHRYYDMGHAKQQKQRRTLAGKSEALDKEELEHLRQRVRVLEGKLETQKTSIETDLAECGSCHCVL